jgi:hypothetical protein
MRYWGLLAVAALVVGTPAKATVLVDQSALITPATSYRLATAGSFVTPSGQQGINRLVQTVTAGLAGRLIGIDLQVYRSMGTGIVSFDLFDGDGTQPTAVSRLSTFIDLATLPASPSLSGASFISVDVGGANYQVMPGQLFSFAIGPATAGARVAVLTGSGPAGNGPAPGNDYAGGTLRVTPNFATYLPVTGDAGFRTIVDVAPLAVPEPATWAMMLIGFGLVGSTVRYRRRSTATTYV